MAESGKALSNIKPGDHFAYLQYALGLARQAPPKPTNFCVGAVVVDEAANTILSTGYTNELPGNTHAEQCAIMKLQSGSEKLDGLELVLYTTMEPCNKRASGNIPCTEKILQACQGKPSINVKTIYIGVSEPETFVGENVGKKKLEDAGIPCVHISGLEAQILEVATAGHSKS